MAASDIMGNKSSQVKCQVKSSYNHKSSLESQVDKSYASQSHCEIVSLIFFHSLSLSLLSLLRQHRTVPLNLGLVKRQKHPNECTEPSVMKS